PELGEVLKWQKVVVRHPRSAVEAEHRPLRRRPIRAIEEVESENLCIALDWFHGCNARRGIRTLPDDCLGTSAIGFEREAVTARGSRPRRSTVLPPGSGRIGGSPIEARHPRGQTR